jgi:hypothetical protein
MLTKAASRKRAQRAISLLGQQCARCGGTWRLQRHHADHQDALAVEILCQSCHTSEEMVSGTWGAGLRQAKICAVCERLFSNYTHVRVKTCSKDCLSELGRRNARKRWDGWTESACSATPSFRRKRKSSAK